MPAGCAKSSSGTKRKPRSKSPLDLLLPYQFRRYRDPARFKITVAARQTGKSFFTAAEAVDACITRPGDKWVCLSASERQAIEWLEKAKDWVNAFKVAVEGEAEDRASAEALLKAAEVRFANGSRIIAIPANPSTARGYSANVILDEFAYHEDPDKMWAAMFPSLSNPLANTFNQRVAAMFKGDSTDIRREQRIHIVSTFNGKQNKFFELWDRREANGYSGELITIHDAIREGLPLDAEQLRTGLDDPAAWAQEYECEPTETSDVLLPYDLIQLAESADASETVDSQFFASRGNPVFVGIDFGRTQDPTVCWSLELRDGILWTREVLVLRNVDTPAQVDILRARIARSTRTCLDYTGPGIGLGDYLAKDFGQYKPGAHEFGRVECCTFTTKFKREIFPALRRRFVAPTTLRVPISRAIREDLHAMAQVVANGEYNYWAPRTREGHSDRCTALALAVRAAGQAVTSYSATCIE